jgi:hypothetical protein
MKSKLLITILSILLVSGCTGLDLGLGQVAGVGGNGMEITSFTAEPATVFSGSTVRLVMEIANQGGTTVPIGGGLVYLTGSSFNDWSGSAALYEPFSREMRAEDVVRGVPASTDRISRTVTAPSLQAGQTRSDIFIGRVYSDYQTSANGNVWVYSETEAEAARAAGRTMYTPSFTYTKGPVGLSISVTPSPIILYAGENSFTLFIKISNLASGTIYAPNVIDYSSNNVALTMDQINRVDVAVTPASGLTITNSADCYGPNQELVSGKDLTMVCDVTVTSPPQTFQSYTFDVTVSYGYYTERTASVTVQGR